MPASHMDGLRNLVFPAGKGVAGLTPALISKILTAEGIGYTKAVRHFRVLEPLDRPALLQNGAFWTSGRPGAIHPSSECPGPWSD